MNVDAWTDWARQNLLQRPEIPFIHSRELDMTADLCDVWCGEFDRAIELLENHMASGYGDIAVRFVVLNFLFRLAHFDSRLPEWAEEDKRPAARQCLGRFVRLQGLEKLDDPKELRWEIVNACAVQDWDRALQLYDLLKSKGSYTEAAIRTLRGQFRFCVVYALREESKGEPLDLYWWAPVIDEVNDTRPILLLCWGLMLDEKEAFSDWERAWLADAANDLEISLSSEPGLFAPYRAVLARCYFLKGTPEDFAKAAKQYEYLLRNGCGFRDPASEGLFKEAWYRNAARAYELSGQAQKAREFLEACLQEFPQSRGAWLRLARLHTQPRQPDYRAAYECLRKEVENDPAIGEDLAVSTALALSGAAEAGQNLSRHFDSHPEHFQPIEAVIRAHWPKFEQLSEDNRKRWVYHAWSLWGERVPAIFQSSRHENACAGFGKVVETELKARIFEVFRATLVQSSSVNDLKRQQAAHPEGNRLWRGSLALGEMFSELDSALHRGSGISGLG